MVRQQKNIVNQERRSRGRPPKPGYQSVARTAVENMIEQMRRQRHKGVEQADWLVAAKALPGFRAVQELRAKYRISDETILESFIESAAEMIKAEIMVDRDALTTQDFRSAYDQEMDFYRFFLGKKFSLDAIAKELEFSSRTTMSNHLGKPLIERLVRTACTLLCARNPEEASPYLAARIRRLAEHADKK